MLCIGLRLIAQGRLDEFALLYKDCFQTIEQTKLVILYIPPQEIGEGSASSPTAVAGVKVPAGDRPMHGYNVHERFAQVCSVLFAVCLVC